MEPTLLAFSCPPSASNSLVRAGLQNEENAPLVDSCGWYWRSNCQLWWTMKKYVVLVISTSTGRKHNLKCGKFANRKATIVCRLMCSVCKMQYVGERVNLCEWLDIHKLCIRYSDPRQNTRLFCRLFKGIQTFQSYKHEIYKFGTRCGVISIFWCEWIWALKTLTAMVLNGNTRFSSHRKHER